jgi:hypothetical protein
MWGLKKKENMMGEQKTREGYSRRNFFKSGASFLAGGLIGWAPGLAFSTSKKPADAPPALPWQWGKIDPMQAGSRAYRYYHDIGG